MARLKRKPRQQPSENAGTSESRLFPAEGPSTSPSQQHVAPTVPEPSAIAPRRTPSTSTNDFASDIPPRRPLSANLDKPLPASPRTPTHLIPRRPVGSPNAGSIQDSPSTAMPNSPSVTQSPPTDLRSSRLRPRIGERMSSIGLRRVPSTEETNARLSPGRPNEGIGIRTSVRSSQHMPTVAEERTGSDPTSPQEPSPTETTRPGLWNRARHSMLHPGWGSHGTHERHDGKAVDDAQDEYDSNMVDVLDTVDAEVATLTSLTNVQNSLFVPDLGRIVNRRPTYTISSRPSSMATAATDVRTAARGPIEAREAGRAPPRPVLPQRESVQSVKTIDSRLSDSRYAVLPHGASLAGWSEADKAELNDHVRHMLHSRRSKFKRAMRGFGQYVKRPLGFLVTLYATLITLFGLAWVLFLIGWINVGGRQLYMINVIDYVLVALFAIVGDGLAPFRAVDTYHMIFIAHYHRLTWKLRNRRALPKLRDHNDLPSRPEEGTDIDVLGRLEQQIKEDEKEEEFSILTQKQQERLVHHQAKFSKSHTFYKPHETETHYAFPLRLLIAIVLLLDCHSLFQIALGACTWGIDYHHRPFALTTVILCCSISCNACAGVLIMIGDRRTRKKDVIERMNRQELTEEAMGKIEKRWEDADSSDEEKLKEKGKERNKLTKGNPERRLF